MALRYPYADGYLAPFVTGAREDQAAALVAELGTFSAYWTEQLTRLQAYIITCTEGMKATDDVFAAKLGAYRKDFEATLSRARAAAATEAADGVPTGGGSFFTVDLQRG